MITRVAERAGLPVRLTAHSSRAGLITTTIRAGKRPDKVREISGHASGSASFWEYVRDASLWQDPGAGEVGGKHRRDRVDRGLGAETGGRRAYPPGMLRK
ncbi:hypothetical protein OG948_59225 (plasmid) [Embleya sp. NBC_00888]|uniref:hypothetical protein n=1 Tax=Embleya sp. NBC_00888 TaxID=2975960 RepID=UPI002F910AC1|nr:hypothetical protein OG948_59225 [Embleya sp. NBC_00888]